MSSRRSTVQARRNGALAAGTKSPEGIKRSSMNALRHGLTAKSLVLSTESQEQFDELLKHYVEFYVPSNTVELDLVHDMVAARWRLQRTRSLETVTLNLRMAQRDAEKKSYQPDVDESARLALAVSYLANSGKSLDLLLRYETTYSRAFDRVQKALEKMQKTRTESITTEELRNEPDPPVPNAPTEPEASMPGNENCETTPSPVHPIPAAHTEPEASAPGNENCETTPSPVHPIPAAHTEPEASAPGNENCETTPSPRTPRQIDAINGPNSRPQSKE